MRASLSLRLGLESWVGRELFLVSTELGVASFSGTGGDAGFSGTLGVGDGFSERGSDGRGGGVALSVEMSMRGLAGKREREPLEAALPGRDGRIKVASGASSESSEESESSEPLFLALELFRARSEKSC